MIVRTSQGQYPIVFTSPDVVNRAGFKNPIIVTDSNIVQCHPEWFEAFENRVVVPAGEASKSWEGLNNLLEQLVKKGAKRNTQLIAFGGGVIGDLVGFAAAIYMRGISLVQIPTTLLAMVDSAVGGKVGIDLPSGKNLVGSFYPPEAVYVCHHWLSTLPERQLRNGMAEIVKYGFISDPNLLKHSADELTADTTIKRCLEIKSEIVERDEYETLGLRAQLNFGHTIGHAIEHLLGYEELLHGEAISIGMVAEAEIGERLGISAPGTRNEVEKTLENLGLPVRIPASLSKTSAQEWISSMSRDKKRLDSGLSFALLEHVGACKLVHESPESLVIKVIDELQSS